VTGRLVADAVAANHPDLGRELHRRSSRVARHLTSVLLGDLCLTLGAGDLTSLPDELLAEPRW